MKMKLTNWTVAFVVACATYWAADEASAVVYRVALSPPAGHALNLGSTTYSVDHAIGLSALNEGHQPPSNATGGVLGGITYDSSTNELFMDFGYGSAFGFLDLEGDFNGGIHIHGDGNDNALYPALNATAGIIAGGDLAGIHTSSGLRSGRVTGAVTLNATQETWLFNNQLYVNVHSFLSPPGEIRGQLVIVPEPSSAMLLAMGVGGFLLRRRRG